MWAPSAAIGVIVAFLGIAIGAAGIWPDVKSFMALWASWIWVHANSGWLVFGLPLSVLFWVVAFFFTRDKDDASIEGAPVQKAPAMANVDNRNGIFNDAPNYGSQTYNEAPRKRQTPPQLSDLIRELANTDVKIQVRIYGQDHEMQSFGRDITAAIANAGLQVILFDGDSGTRYLKGVAVEPAPNSVSRDAGANIARGLSEGGLSVSLADGPEVWKDQKFVRIGIGGNE
jgi:hypothetical protein